MATHHSLTPVAVGLNTSLWQYNTGGDVAAGLSPIQLQLLYLNVQIQVWVF